MNSELKADFIKVIKRQTDEYRKLKSIIFDESRLLVDKNIRGVEETIKREDGILDGLKAIELEKKDVFTRIRQDVNSGKPLTLGDLLKKIDKKDAKDIENAVIELINITKDIDISNKSNMHMIKNYLEYTEFMKKIKERNEQTVQTTYNEFGYKKSLKTPQKPSIDKKI